MLAGGLDRKQDISSFWYPLGWIGLFEFDGFSVLSTTQSLGLSVQQKKMPREAIRPMRDGPRMDEQALGFQELLL
jgi:hypothetical protein